MSRPRYTGATISRDRFLPPLESSDKIRSERGTKETGQKCSNKSIPGQNSSTIPSNTILSSKSPDKLTEDRLSDPQNLFNCPFCKAHIPPYFSTIVQHLFRNHVNLTMEPEKIQYGSCLESHVPDR